MKKKLIHPTLPKTGIIIKETVVTGGTIEEIETVISLPTDAVLEYSVSKLNDISLITVDE